MKLIRFPSGQGLGLLLIAVLFAGQAAIFTARGDDTGDQRGQLTALDYKFARAAAASGMTEVTLGNLAGQHSVTPAIQDFARRLVQDHGRAAADLEQLAAKKGAALSSQPSPEQQRQINLLSGLTGKDFDDAFLAITVRDHKVDEKEFKRASEKSHDRELKAFAEYNLRVVQEHLRLAQDLDQNFKPSTSAK